MSGSDKRRPSAPPPFEHVLYGLPSEIDASVAVQERRRGKRGSGRRKVLAAGVVAVLLTGGVTGAYAVQQRSVEEGTPTKALLDVSREDLILAAEVDAARIALEESLAVARDVYDASEDILDDDDDAADLRIALDDALTGAEQILQQDADQTDLADVSGASDAIHTTTAAVESAMDERARANLTEALAAANEVLALSVGIVAEQLRVELSEAVDDAQEMLDAGDEAPQTMIDAAELLTELSQPVTAAVETFEQERLAELQPAVPPAPSDGRSTSGGGTPNNDDTSTRPPNRESTRPPPPPNDEEPAQPDPEPTDPSDDPPNDPTPAPSESPTEPTGDQADLLTDA